MILQKLYSLFNPCLSERPSYDIDIINLKPWWGEISLEVGKTYFWEINDIVVCVHKEDNKIYVANFGFSKLEWVEQLTIPELLREPQLKFKGFSWEKPRILKMLPTFPNKPLVSKLPQPLYVLPKEHVWLYMSSPLVLNLVTEKPDIVLEEINIYKLSDTWLGNNTVEGELCYYSGNKCSTKLVNLKEETNKVITPILIANKTSRVLQLKSICLPVPFLSIYNHQKNYLWTEEVHILHYEDKKIKFSLQEPDLENFTLLAPARKGAQTKGMLQELFFLLTGYSYGI